MEELLNGCLGVQYGNKPIQVLVAGKLVTRDRSRLTVLLDLGLLQDFAGDVIHEFVRVVVLNIANKTDQISDHSTSAVDLDM